VKPIIIPLSMSSVFLLPCPGGYLQVDAGYQHDYPAYCRNLPRAGIALESVRYLLFTTIWENSHENDQHLEPIHLSPLGADL